MAAVSSVETDMSHDMPLPPQPAEKHPTALTPPTSEDLDKREDASSELSDLEPDDVKEEEAEDDIGDVEPDHYYGDGKIPVFKPVCTWYLALAAAAGGTIPCRAPTRAEVRMNRR